MISRGAKLVAFALALVAGGRHPQALLQINGAHAPLVDVNFATIPTLRAALKISNDEAAQIVAHRPYESVEEFKTKAGLAPGEIERLAPLVTVQPVGPVRQPNLPPGAVPISPDTFRKGASPDASGGNPVPLPGARTPVPVPPGTVQRIPVPPGTVQRNIPVPPGTQVPRAQVPGAPGAGPPILRTQPAPAQTRDLRGAFVYGLTAVVVAIAAFIYWKRTSPTRNTGRP